MHVNYYLFECKGSCLRCGLPIQTAEAKHCQSQIVIVNCGGGERTTLLSQVKNERFIIFPNLSYI